MKVDVVRKRIFNEVNSQVVRINTSPGFGTPTAALLFYLDNSANLNGLDTTTSERNLGVGMLGPSFTGSGLASINHTIFLADNSASTLTLRGHSPTRFFAASNSARVAYWQGTSPVFERDALRFTLSKGTVPTNLDLVVVFFGGLGCSAGVGFSHLNLTDANDRVIDNFTFTPDAIITSFVGTNGFNASAAADGILSLGVSHRSSPISQAYTIFNEYSNTAAVDTRAGFGTEMICKRASATGVNVPPAVSAGSGGSIFSYNSTGFTMRTTLGAQAANYFFNYFLLAAPERIKTGFFTTPSATGNTFIDLGFVPQFVMGSSVGGTLFQAQYTVAPESNNISYWFAMGPQANNTFYKGTGTISASTGSATITGTGTSFMGQINEGDILVGPAYEAVGTVSSVGGSTSLTLTGSSSNNITAGSDYFYKRSGQFNIVFGDADGALDTAVFSGIMTTAPTLYNTTQYSSGSFIAFDSRPGFTVNYSDAQTVPRLNWYFAVEAEPRRKRRSIG
jgi:hypothetical protein